MIQQGIEAQDIRITGRIFHQSEGAVLLHEGAFTGHPGLEAAGYRGHNPYRRLPGGEYGMGLHHVWITEPEPQKNQEEDGRQYEGDAPMEEPSGGRTEPLLIFP